MFVQPIPTLRRDGDRLVVLDQTALPWRREERRLATLEEVAEAIVAMRVRGAPLIGAVAAHGVALALAGETPDDAALDHALAVLRSTRPTAVNLARALARMRARLRPLPVAARREAAWAEAAAILAEDHVAAPMSSFDARTADGAAISIEKRAAEEVLAVTGANDGGRPQRLRLSPEGARAANPAFDITPAALVSSFITEHGVAAARLGALPRQSCGGG
jgi:methylthioribose-1-phosphate isomerase